MIAADIHPITDAERPRCAYCGKGLHPLWPENERFNSEEAFSHFKTNRRVYAIRRSYNYQTGNHYIRTGESVSKKDRVLSHIEVSYFPDRADKWGYDGSFCTAEHGRLFAHAALRAGYKITAKVK